jgi:hypothetical protein
MSFETRVLIDGAWVTRTVDLQTVLDLDREASPRTRPQLPLPNGDPPNMGILTKTLVRSPVVLWIIPARIRHEDKNDVLFIGVSPAWSLIVYSFANIFSKIYHLTLANPKPF